MSVEWPQGASEKERFLRSIPLVFWERDVRVSELTPLFCQHIERITLRGPLGDLNDDIWRDARRGFLMVFREPEPPSLTLLAYLQAEGNVMTCEFKFLSGEPAAEFTHEVSEERPLIMGQLNLIAYRAAFDAGLLQSIFQDVTVLLAGFMFVVPEGVLLWHGPGRDGKHLGLALEELQSLSYEELQRRDRRRLPEFVEAVRRSLQDKLPSERVLLWRQYMGDPELERQHLE